MLGGDDAVLRGVASLLAPGAEATALVSVTARDGVPPIPEPTELAAAYATHGLRLVEARSATAAEIAASGSTWAKRLGAGTRRPVSWLRLAAPHAPGRAQGATARRA